MARKKKESKPKGIERSIASNISEVVELENNQRKKRTVAEQLSEVIARFCGSMTFVYVHIAWFGFWIIFNDFGSVAFDPYPYTFLTLIVSLEAIFLSTFILISQNHDTQLSERRNHLDLQINLLAEQENTKMLELLQAIAAKVGVTRDPEVDSLLEPIDPKKLVKQIVKASGEEEKKNGAKTEKAAK
jgi:uncharacterized membrane protein